MKDPIALGVWLDIIDKALPLIIKMGEATGKVVDWIIEHNAPKEETKNL